MIEVPTEEKKEEKKDVIDAENKIEKTETKLLNEVGNLYKEINKDKVNISNLQSSINSLASYNNAQEYDYLHNLLKPEKCKGGKIPSSIPVPSCAFQLHNCVTLTTNSSGNIGIMFNPFFLASENVTQENISLPGGEDNPVVNANYLTSLWVNNDDTLTGSSPNENWDPYDIGQVIPGVYDQFRLVSASVVIKYIGRLDIVSGVIGGAIIFDENRNVGSQLKVTHAPVQVGGDPTITYPMGSNPGLAKYGNFDLAMDSFYHQENLTLEGIRELYFPVDNSFEEYVKVTDNSILNYNFYSNSAPPQIQSYTCVANQDYYKSGFNFMIYTLGAPINSACLKLDIYCNFECLPNAKFLNYLPISMTPYHLNINDKNRASRIIQQKPVMKSKEEEENSSDVPNIWLKLKRKFGNSLPGIQKMINNGLINAVPSLKPGISLAAAMMNIEDDY